VNENKKGNNARLMRRRRHTTIMFKFVYLMLGLKCGKDKR